MEIPDHTNQKFLVLEIKHRASDMLGKPLLLSNTPAPGLCVCVYTYVHMC